MTDDSIVNEYQFMEVFERMAEEVSIVGHRFNRFELFEFVDRDIMYHEEMIKQIENHEIPGLSCTSHMPYFGFPYRFRYFSKEIQDIILKDIIEKIDTMKKFRERLAISHESAQQIIDDFYQVNGYYPGDRFFLYKEDNNDRPKDTRIWTTMLRNTKIYFQGLGSRIRKSVK